MATTSDGVPAGVERESVELTRTVRLKLQASDRKRAIVRKGIDAYQQVAAFMADRVPTYPEYAWSQQNTQMYHQAKRGLPDDGVNYKTTLAQMAMNDVVESYQSWSSNGKPGDSPKGEYGDAPYLNLRGDDSTIADNGDAGYGFKASFIAYKPVWFRIDAGAFQREFLERICDPDDDASAGTAELHLADDGTLYAHQTVSWSVERIPAGEAPVAVGVDLNDDPLAVAAAWNRGAECVDGVEFVSGGEYRHHRERSKRRKDEAMADGNLKAITDSRRDYWRYTDHITNVASRRVVDFASEHAPACIQLEDLTHLRESVEDPIHDWPYGEIQEKIVSKATEEGIAVQFIDPRNTSQTCRKCGHTTALNRDDREFACQRCGYEVHADVNAAINIAQSK
jgi:putative transposase